MAMRRSSRSKSAWTLVVLLTLGGMASVYCGGGGGGPSSPTAPPEPSTIIGSGIVAQESRNVSGFDELSLVGVGTVYLEQGNSESVLVQAEDNLLPYLRTEVVGGVLRISIASGVSLQSTEPFEFFVTATQMREARLDGVGEIQCEGLTAGQLRLVSDGVGDMKFDNLDLNRLEVETSGVGQVRVKGQVSEQDVSMSGTGLYQARNLRSSRATVEIRSAGSATVRVSDHLTATVSGSGCVYYLGDPTVEASITGAGCVEQIGD